MSYRISEGKSIDRFIVPTSQRSWHVPFPDYKPVYFTLSHPLADTENTDTAKSIPFNKLNSESNIERRSHVGIYELSNGGLPLNPRGRTGVAGRGVLWRWGPNHAADPIVTRWKRDECGEILECEGRQVLEFVAIQRRDTGEWAFPGGMVEPGDDVPKTLLKEFGEEAMNSDSLKDEKKDDALKLVEELFENGVDIYKGYVDDPRNTDNSWMETVAKNFHDGDGTATSCWSLQAGSDACKVRWMKADKSLKLYASHVQLLKLVCDQYDAFW
eukprot:158248_1